MENNIKIIGTKEFEDNNFQILEKEDGKYLIGLFGRLASEQEFDTSEEAGQYIEKRPWELITSLICAITSGIIKETIKEIKDPLVTTNKN